MVLLWGDMLLETALMREARALGIPVVFYLVSGAYKSKDTFRDVSVIVTDTGAPRSPLHGVLDNAISVVIRESGF